MKKLLIAALVSSVALFTVVGAFSASATKPNPEHKVDVCHRTGSATNPYVFINVDIASSGYVKGGHTNHEQVGNGLGGDIIAAYDYEKKDGTIFSFPGKNLDTIIGGITGAELLANGCVLPDTDTEVTAAAPLFTDPTCDEGASLVLPEVEGVTYAVEGEVAAGSTVTVTATADEGYVLTEGSESEWTHTFGEVPTDCGTPGEATAALTQGDCDNAAFVTLVNGTEFAVDFEVNGETVTVPALSQQDVEVAFGAVLVTSGDVTILDDEAVAPQGCNTIPPPPDDNPPAPPSLPETL